MLLKRLASLACKLDDAGHTKEAEAVDKILKQIIAFWKTQNMPNCTCQCESCVYGRDLIGRPASKDHHSSCTTGQCEIKKELNK